MYKNFAWNQFMKTGNLETYMEYKRIEELDNMIEEKKGEVIDETCQSERNRDKGSNI